MPTFNTAAKSRFMKAFNRLSESTVSCCWSDRRLFTSIAGTEIYGISPYLAFILQYTVQHKNQHLWLKILLVRINLYLGKSSIDYVVIVRQNIISDYTWRIHVRYAVIIHLAKSGIVQQLVYKYININSWLPGCVCKYYYLHQRPPLCNDWRCFVCLSLFVSLFAT